MSIEPEPVNDTCPYCKSTNTVKLIYPAEEYVRGI